MSDQTYLALFADGPQEGVTESRVLTGDSPDQEVPVVAAVEGVESIFRYRLAETKEIDGHFHATYRFDAGDSDPVAADSDGDNEESISGIY
jgi:hypothetical protein